MLNIVLTCRRLLRRLVDARVNDGYRGGNAQGYSGMGVQDEEQEAVWFEMSAKLDGALSAT